MVEQRLHVLGAELGRTDVLPPPLRQSRNETDGAAQIVPEGPAHDLAYLVEILAQEGVHHERDRAAPRVPGLVPGLPVQLDLLGELLDALTQEMGQEVGALPSGVLVRLRCPGRRHEDRQLGLDGPRIRVDLVRRALTPGSGDRLAPPEPPQLVHLLDHDVAAVLVVLRLEDEVPVVPPRSERELHPPVREVVDDGPVFGHAYGVVQREHDASRPDLHVPGDHRQRARHDGRTRVDAAELVEVPLGHPDGRESVRVREPRPFEEQVIGVGPVGLRLAREVEEAEVDRLGGDTDAHAHRRLGLVRLDHHRTAACERPEQLEHRDIERDAGDGEPGDRALRVDPLVHADEEVRHVAVLDHHALGAPGRTGCEDHVGELLRAHLGQLDFGRGLDLGPVPVETHVLGAARGKLTEQVLAGEQDGAAAVLDHEGDAVLRIRRVERHVGPARLQDAEQPHHHFDRAVDADADQRLAADPQAAQVPRHARRTRVELRVGQSLVAEHDRGRVGRRPRLALEEAVHGGALVECALGVVPLHQEHALFGRRQERKGAELRVRPRERPVEQLDEVPSELLDEGPVEQIGVVLEMPGETMLARHEREGHVVLGRVERHIDLAHREPRRTVRRGGRVLQDEHDLEERRAADVARQFQRIDHPVERQVLMRERPERHLTRAAHELPERPLRSRVEPQRQRVHEEPDQRLGLRVGATGRGRADDDVFLAGVPTDQR